MKKGVSSPAGGPPAARLAARQLHVNNRDDYTIVVSENRQLARSARTMIMSDDACSVMVPRLEWDGFALEAWDRRGPTVGRSATDGDRCRHRRLSRKRGRRPRRWRISLATAGAAPL